MQKISSLLFAAFFWIASSGIVVYQTHCACSGKDAFSLYFSPETCLDQIHHEKRNDIDKHEGHQDEEICARCQIHLHHCGCAAPSVIFLKLKNLMPGEGYSFYKPVFPLLQPFYTPWEEKSFISVPESLPIALNIEPPEHKPPSRKIIILNCQLKIPFIS